VRSSFSGLVDFETRAGEGEMDAGAPNFVQTLPISSAPNNESMDMP
jgi:hypothetical protein